MPCVLLLLLGPDLFAWVFGGGWREAESTLESSPSPGVAFVAWPVMPTLVLVERRAGNWPGTPAGRDRHLFRGVGRTRWVAGAGGGAELRRRTGVGLRRAYAPGVLGNAGQPGALVAEASTPRNKWWFARPPNARRPGSE